MAASAKIPSIVENYVQFLQNNLRELDMDAGKTHNNAVETRPVFKPGED